MNPEPIPSDDDLNAALARVEALWGAPTHTAEGDELEILSILIEKYEAERYPMPASDPLKPSNS